MTRYPPSTSTARPDGAMTPLTTTSCPPPVSCAPSGAAGRTWSTPAIPLFNAHHAAEPSCRASSSMTASTVSGSASRPPRWRGATEAEEARAPSAPSPSRRAGGALARPPRRGAAGRSPIWRRCGDERVLVFAYDSPSPGRRCSTVTSVRARHSPVVGSRTEVISLTALTGTPTRSACSRIAASSSARYTQYTLSLVT